MNRPEQYKRTVDILYQAYFNDTLVHNSCYACAVGNLVAANMGYTMSVVNGSPKTFGRTLVWKKGRTILPYPNADNGGWPDCVYIEEGGASKSAIEQVESTGYTGDELLAIELAFESAKDSYVPGTEACMFAGLSSVLAVLATLHEVEDPTPALERFINLYKNKRHANTTAIPAR